ncbi:MAG: hypothetical protein VXW16_04710 [Bacteroidota bacterium]|nr:hypothetical protein [Bacteroidota bacterium]MEC8568915.1 hypothetical protein [Pseudomonadota bacterium]
MSNLLTAESPLIILPSLASEFGIAEAIILQQIHYMSQQTDKGIIHNGHKWIYNTLDQWHAKLSCWSMATIERAITKLRKLGIILVDRLGHHKSIRTNYYRIDYPKLAHIPQLAIPATCENDSRTTQESPPQNAGTDTRKMKESTPSKCRNGITKNTQENPKKSFKSQKPTFENLNGSDAPTQPDPTPDQLASIPTDQRQLWQQLRHAKLDIAIDDPHLRFWLDRRMVKTITQTLLDHLDGSGHWHTPAQLNLPSPNWRTAA